VGQKDVSVVPFYQRWPMIQDRQGYIWYVENSGKIGKWLPGDPLSDADVFDEFSGCDFVNIVREDIKGHVWISTGCRFYRYDPVRKKFEDIQQSIFDQTNYRQLHTESWINDSSGMVWFGGSALISYSTNTQKIDTHFVTKGDGMRFNLFNGENNTVWFSGMENLGNLDFNQYDPRQKKIIRSLKFPFNDLKTMGFMTVNVKTEKIRGIHDESYILFIGGTVHLFDPAKESLSALTIPEEYGYAVETCSNNTNNFVATSNGAVLMYEPEKKTFQLVWQHPGKKPVEMIVPARIGATVLAYADNGIYPISLTEPLFKRIFKWNDSLSSYTNFNRFSSINGKVYLNMRTTPKLISHFPKDSITFNPPLKYAPDYSYTIGSIPGRSEMWLLVRYYPFQHPEMKPMLNLCDSNGNVLKSFLSPLLDSTFRRSFCLKILTGSDQVSWIIATDGGVIKFDRKTELFELVPNIKIPMMNAPIWVMDKENNLWFGSREIGLLRYDKEKKEYIAFNHDPGNTKSIASDNVTALLPDSDSLLWIGTTNKGLSVLNIKNGTAAHLGKEHGLPELIIKDIFEDNSGGIWVSTLQYLCKWSPQANRFIIFSKEDGLAIDDNFSTMQFLQEEDGKVYFNHGNDVYMFNRDRVQSYQSYLPPLLFTDFLVDNKKVVIGEPDSVLPTAINFIDQIKLQYSQNKFTIHYAAVEFYGTVQYAYQLVGFDDDLQLVKNRTSAMYTNVPPGQYTFRLKALNSQGFWTPFREISILVKAPWYRTWLAYVLYFVLFVTLIWAFVRYRSRYLLKENQRLEEKVKLRTHELSNSLKELNETQHQLVQREKMASLGELTAGIAHEIQNPLNFVNNFSDVNQELIDEMNEEIDRGNMREVKMIAENLKDNEQKINHHGKRADAIVKSMLQHSRTSSGKYELVDINSLAEEFLRLSYHGQRAKNKSFNAELHLDLDPLAGKLNIVGQDIGRVFLNLFNNALYAVTEKLSTAGGDNLNYKPGIWLFTQRTATDVTIKVKDNGNGIPEGIREKIFQPFFTTKPTGMGTGLGLSLSYDIIKAHGGQIIVNSVPGEGAEFIITLPLQTV
jgi:signal transduction histidine kinase